jgi:hypothetical protein
VRKAKHRTTGQHVAIKIYPKNHISDSDRECMEVEIAVLKQIDHPNVIKLLDFFEDEKYLCLVIELMEGGELYDYVKEKNHLSEGEAKEIVRIMIDALSYCH